MGAYNWWQETKDGVWDQEGHSPILNPHAPPTCTSIQTTPPTHTSEHVESSGNPRKNQLEPLGSVISWTCRSDSGVKWLTELTARKEQEVCQYSLLLWWVRLSSSELDPEPTDELSWLSGCGSVRNPSLDSERDGVCVRERMRSRLFGLMSFLIFSVIQFPLLQKQQLLSCDLCPVKHLMQ